MLFFISWLKKSTNIIFQVKPNIRRTTLITLIHLKPAKDQASSKRKSLVDSMSMEEDEDDEFFDARERLGQIFLWNRLTHLTQIVSAM